MQHEKLHGCWESKWWVAAGVTPQKLHPCLALLKDEGLLLCLHESPKHSCLEVRQYVDGGEAEISDSVSGFILLLILVFVCLKNVLD